MPQRFLSIKNFYRYQHYKNRNPPWIRLYYAILDDPAFTALDEVQQSRLMKLLLIASKQNNEILDDPYYLAKMLRVTEPVDITPLIRSGFVLAQRKRRASVMLAKSSLISDSSDHSDNTSQILQCNGSVASTKRKRELTSFPDDWKLTDEDKAGWLRCGLNAAIEFASFRDHALANDRRCADWSAAFRNWCRKSINQKESKPYVPTMQR